MKKSATTVLLFFFNCTFVFAQKWIKITGPCNNEYLKNVSGDWIHWGDPWYAKVSKQQEQEIRRRVETIHQFVFTLTPTLSGIDAAWGIHSTDYDFAQQARKEYLQGGQSRMSFYNGIPLVSYTYGVGFFQYSCGRDGQPNEMRKGYPREDGASLSVSVNTLNKFIRRDYGGTEGMQIDGRNIKTMPPVKGKWKGYTLYHTESGDAVLLHRDGILPYIAVTRKQYLELAISYFNKFFDNSLAEGAKLYEDMGMKPDPTEKEKWLKQKTNVIEYYQHELTTTSKAGLLDSPAIVSVFLNPNPLADYPIFIPDTEGGYRLVTENPAYFRKDLPKYIPQLFVLFTARIRWLFIPKNDPMDIIEERFPIERLQALIDK